MNIINQIIYTFSYILFISTFIGLIFCVQIKFAKQKFIINFSIAIIIWYAILIFITELLSIFKVLTFSVVFVFWLFLSGGEILYLFFHKKNITIKLINIIKNKINDWKNDYISILLFCVICFILLCSTYFAITTVPNVYDSMTYHMARIMFWIEHRSVEYYMTNIPRQLWIPAYPEYINLHVFILTNNDIFANMAQNFSAYGCVIITYHILKDYFSISRRKSLFGVFFIISANIFWVESTTTQTDMIAAFMMMNIINVLLFLSDNICLIKNKYNIFVFIVTGLACGILYGIKSNACISILIFIIYIFLYRIYKKDKLIDLIIFSFISVFSAIFISLPIFLRNFKYFGDFLVMKYTSTVSIGSFSPRYIIINLVKNISSVLPSSDTGGAINYTVRSFSNFLGVDVNSCPISFNNCLYSVYYSCHMDLASARMNMIIILISTGLIICKLIFMNNKRWGGIEKKDVVASIFIFQFYITSIIVRWQPWVVRLLLPSLILASIASIYYYFEIMSIVLNKKAWAYACIVMIFFYNSSKYCFDEIKYCYTVKMLSEKQYDRFQEYYFWGGNGEACNDMCDLIDRDKFDTIGLYSGEDSFQYPILKRYYDKIRIENVILSREDLAYGNDKYTVDYIPDAICVVDIELDEDELYFWNGVKYSCVYSCDSYNCSLWEKMTK